MTKNILISYNEADESFLMALFKKLKVKTLSASKSEIEIIRQRLHHKYVVNNKWATMSEEEREDAAHAETMLYAQEQPDHHVYTSAETKAFRAKLRTKLTTNADH